MSTAELTDLDETVTPELAATYADSLSQIEAEAHRLAVLLRRAARRAGK